jgi:hypothetical protein
VEDVCPAANVTIALAAVKSMPAVAVLVAVVQTATVTESELIVERVRVNTRFVVPALPSTTVASEMEIVGSCHARTM